MLPAVIHIAFVATTSFRTASFGWVLLKIFYGSGIQGGQGIQFLANEHKDSPRYKRRQRCLLCCGQVVLLAFDTNVVFRRAIICAEFPWQDLALVCGVQLAWLVPICAINAMVEKYINDSNDRTKVTKENRKKTCRKEGTAGFLNHSCKVCPGTVVDVNHRRHTHEPCVLKEPQATCADTLLLLVSRLCAFQTTRLNSH